MDINAVLSHARKNQKESVNVVSRYTTNVKPAKKLPRPNVNPKAIKAFLNKKKDTEKQQLIDAQNKKEELQKLRHASKSTKKANAMAKRTKDNLKVYRGEDVTGSRRRSEPPSPPLSPQADRRHRAFMKNIVPKVKVPEISDSDSGDGYQEPVCEEEEKRMRKLQKRREKARCASNLEFSDLLQLAEKHKYKAESSSDEDDDSEQDSDGSVDAFGRPLSAEEKYQRERRKRRQLEERLKMASSKKKSRTHTHEVNREKSSGNLANFKIGKLNSSMTEASKREKAKALAEKFKKAAKERTESSQGLQSSCASVKPQKKREERRNGDRPITKSSSMSSLNKKRFSPKPPIIGNNIKRKDADSKLDKRYNETDNTKHQSKSHKTHPTKTQPRDECSRNYSGQKKPQATHQTTMGNHFKPVKRTGSPSDNSSSSSSRHKQPQSKSVSNPYKHTVIKQGSGLKRPISETLADPWSKANKRSNSQVSSKKKTKPTHPPSKCTLSVTSEAVKTNYPGVAHNDPYIMAYKKSGNGRPKLTPEMVARYKAAMILKARQREPSHHAPPMKRRYGVINDDSEDEYDSELEDFIADNDEEIEEDIDVSSQIKQIFGYDRTKYARESEWELSRMDASYKDIEKEEKRSLRIAKEEDAREAKLEEERMQKMLKKKR